MALKCRNTVDENTPHVTSIFQNTGGHAVIDHEVTTDEEILVSLGYKQEFKRELSIWSSFGVSFSCLGLLPSIASTLGYNLGYSGTAGSVWGWLVAGILIQFVAFAMAELCSSMPTAGGLYYASAVLAPEGYGPLCSWITGWSNFAGEVTAPCAVNYALAAMILTAAQIVHPDYVIQTWHVYLLLLSLLVLQGLLAMNSTKFVGVLNTVGTITNVIVLLIFVIWFPAGSINEPKTNPSSTVWTSEGIVNGTEWPTGFAFLMGFLSVIWTLSGYDAPFHLSEECSNANISGPRAIVMTAQLGLWLGWAIILVIAYTVKDIQDVVSGEYGQPMGSLCLQVLGPKAGLAMFSLNMVAQFFVGQGVTVVSSRVVYAYSRDGALPGSHWLKQVNPHTKTPVYAVWFVLTLGALLGLLMFASPVAIGAVFSMGAIAQYIAFVFPIALKVFSAKGRFRPGPWNLGRFSTPIGVVAVGWVVLIIPILCFPSVTGADLNDLNMNYTCLIYGGTMTLAMCWYAISARKWFKGPKINVEHMIHKDGSGNGSRNAEMDNAIVGKDGQTVGEDGSDKIREGKELNGQEKKSG
ncbi:putative amino acid permease protein [Botrytis fragariae]|uniref:Putative amino acid permease protein n=1 Tax=Botrytis fragariae TaxID=1964551 RepID=A0A8H6EKL4_9HELO|nr:putative amino acid permease protein [Botrytis fragariae]KAF5875669.1 putative amino acid permease protein [Botrytis fragariae]